MFLLPEKCVTSERASSRYGYPDAITPEPTPPYNPHSLERASSMGKTPYAANGDLSYASSNGYNGASVNGGSAATSPTPYATNGYNGNEYSGYSEGSMVGANGNGNLENGSTVNSYNSNENGGAQFVRRRLLPAIPKGENTHTMNNVVCHEVYRHFKKNFI